MLAAVASILIRDVPDEVRAELAARAARKGQSMQEFLKAALVGMVAKPDIETWVEQVERHLAEREGPGATAEEIVADIREMRGSL
jgi:antitoxin FitA